MHASYASIGYRTYLNCLTDETIAPPVEEIVLPVRLVGQWNTIELCMDCPTSEQKISESSMHCLTSKSCKMTACI